MDDPTHGSALVYSRRKLSEVRGCAARRQAPAPQRRRRSAGSSEGGVQKRGTAPCGPHSASIPGQQSSVRRVWPSEAPSCAWRLSLRARREQVPMELFKLATARPIRAVDLGQCSAAAPLACPPRGRVVAPCSRPPA